MATVLATVAALKPACPAVRARGNSFTGKALMASGTDGGCTYFISVVNCSCSRYFESIQGDPVCWGLIARISCGLCIPNPVSQHSVGWQHHGEEAAGGDGSHFRNRF